MGEGVSVTNSFCLVLLLKQKLLGVYIWTGPIKSLIYPATHEKSQIFTANLPIFSFVPQFYLVKCYFSEFYYGHVPLCTTLGLITHKLMDLNFSKNKSDLTGLCRKMNNFDFKFLKNVKKIRVILSLVLIQCGEWHLKAIFHLIKYFTPTV